MTNSLAGQRTAAVLAAAERHGEAIRAGEGRGGEVKVWWLTSDTQWADAHGIATRDDGRVLIVVPQHTWATFAGKRVLRFDLCDIDPVLPRDAVNRYAVALPFCVEA